MVRIRPKRQVGSDTPKERQKSASSKLLDFESTAQEFASERIMRSKVYAIDALGGRWSTSLPTMDLMMKRKSAAVDALKRGQPRIELGTSPTRTANATTTPLAQNDIPLMERSGNRELSICPINFTFSRSLVTGDAQYPLVKSSLLLSPAGHAGNSASQIIFPYSLQAIRPCTPKANKPI